MWDLNRSISQSPHRLTKQTKKLSRTITDQFVLKILRAKTPTGGYGKFNGGEFGGFSVGRSNDGAASSYEMLYQT